jgi:hypothetical protein
MRKPHEIEKLADDTLKSIDNLKQVEANNFIYTRIAAKLFHEPQKQHIRAVKVLSRLSAALLLFIGLNVLSFYFLSDSKEQPAKQVKATDKTGVAEAFASEYHLTTSQYNY